MLQLLFTGNQWERVDKGNYLYSHEWDVFLIKAPDLMKKPLPVLSHCSATVTACLLTAQDQRCSMWQERSVLFKDLLWPKCLQLFDSQRDILQISVSISLKKCLCCSWSHCFLTVDNKFGTSWPKIKTTLTAVCQQIRTKQKSPKALVSSTTYKKGLIPLFFYSIGERGTINNIWQTVEETKTFLISFNYLCWQILFKKKNCINMHHVLECSVH